MTKLTKYRRYRKRGYRRFKYIAANYAYCKMTVAFRIRLESTGTKIIFESYSGNSIGLPSFLTSCHDWPSYRNLYMTFKIKAIKINLTPLPSPEFDGSNQLAAFNIFESALHIGLLSNSDDVTVQSIAESEKTGLVNWNQPTTLYWKFAESLTDWYNTSTTSTVTSKIACGSFTVPTDSNFFKVWEGNCHIYCLFKNTA